MDECKGVTGSYSVVVLLSRGTMFVCRYNLYGEWDNTVF